MAALDFIKYNQADSLITSLFWL